MRMVRKKVSSEAADPTLNPGWAYYCETAKYKEHLDSVGDQRNTVSHVTSEKYLKYSLLHLSDFYLCQASHRHRCEHIQVWQPVLLGHWYYRLHTAYYETS